MVAMTSLWLPILLSAVLAFIVSSVVHMLLTYLRSDLVKLPGEDGIGEALRKADVPPGDYMIPHAKDMKEAQTPEMVKKFESGPVAILTVYPNGPVAMGKALGLWFVYLILANIVVAYLASRTVAADAVQERILREATIVPVARIDAWIVTAPGLALDPGVSPSLDIAHAGWLP